MVAAPTGSLPREGVTRRLALGEQNVDIADDTEIYRGEEAPDYEEPAGIGRNLDRSPGGRVEVPAYHDRDLDHR